MMALCLFHCLRIILFYYRNHNPQCGYHFDTEHYEACYGIPTLIEQTFGRELSANFMKTILIENLTLWKRPLYSRYISYYCALFNLVKSGMPITSTTKLLSSKLTVIDAATMLGFDVIIPVSLYRQKFPSKYPVIIRSVC